MTKEEKEECIAALDAMLEGEPIEIEHGFISVHNPDATDEAIALQGINPNLVIDLQKLKSFLEEAV